MTSPPSLDDIPHTKRTFTFKHIRGLPLQLDVYSPPADAQRAASTRRPAVLYFHGGGVITGDRTTVRREWIMRAAMRRKWTVISADYRCLPESTGLDLLSDLHDAYVWTTRRAQEVMPERPIDAQRVVLLGDSGGGYCALLLAMHLAHTQGGTGAPAAVWLLYPMVDPAVNSRPGRSVMGTPVEDVSGTLAEIDRRIASGEVSFGEAYTADVSNVFTQERFPVFKAVFQEGLFAEYLTGVKGMRDALSEKGVEGVGMEERLRILFPLHFGNVDGRMPPVVVAHGTADSAVDVKQSEKLAQRCKETGVQVELWTGEGSQHGFDVFYKDVEAPGGEPGAEALRRCLEAVDKYV